jgi:transketolase
MSAADLIAVLITKHLHYDFDSPRRTRAATTCCSRRAHASPLLSSILRAAGAISEEELFTYRRFGSPLEGHPTLVLPWAEVVTGSLGQRLPTGVGGWRLPESGSTGFPRTRRA